MPATITADCRTALVPRKHRHFFDVEALRVIHFQESAAGVAEDLRHFRQVIKNPRVPAQTAWLRATKLKNR